MKGLRSATGKTSQGGELWSLGLSSLYRGTCLMKTGTVLGLPIALSPLQGEEGGWVFLEGGSGTERHSPPCRKSSAGARPWEMRAGRYTSSGERAGPPFPSSASKPLDPCRRRGARQGSSRASRTVKSGRDWLLAQGGQGLRGARAVGRRCRGPSVKGRGHARTAVGGAAPSTNVKRRGLGGDDWSVRCRGRGGRFWRGLAGSGSFRRTGI